jgi:hypothetical protein
MRSTMGRLTAGIGYGFLGGAAAGLTAGVITEDLFFWTIAGTVAGVAVGCAIALAAEARVRQRERRFEPAPESAGTEGNKERSRAVEAD